MFGSQFYDYTCTVYETSYTKVDWSQEMVTNEIYSDIPCSYWRGASKNLQEWQSDRQVDVETFNLDLQPQYTNVRKWYLVKLYNDLGEVWVFSIWKVEVFKRLNWMIDNISLVITSKDGGSV